MRPAPRLFGICATAADVVAVLRRGPSDWTHLGLWDLTSEQFHSGSWLRARVYQQRCDLSPDGRYLCYFALNGGAQWDAGDTYIAVSGCRGSPRWPHGARTAPTPGARTSSRTARNGPFRSPTRATTARCDAATAWRRRARRTSQWSDAAAGPTFPAY